MKYGFSDCCGFVLGCIENLKADLHLDLKPDPSFEVKENLLDEKKKEVKTEAEHIAAQTFSYKELAAATKNFKSDCLLGEGGFGRVYKGKLESINQVCLWFIILWVILFYFGHLIRYLIIMQCKLLV